MIDGCINVLIKCVLEVDLLGNDVCEKLQIEFLVNLDFECVLFVIGNNWVDVIVVDLLGDGFFQFIDSDRNVSFDCWFIFLRNNDFWFVYFINLMVSYGFMLVLW